MIVPQNKNKNPSSSPLIGEDVKHRSRSLLTIPLSHGSVRPLTGVLCKWVIDTHHDAARLSVHREAVIVLDKLLQRRHLLIKIVAVDEHEHGRSIERHTIL